MNTNLNTQAAAQDQAVAKVAKYKAQRATRTRFSFAGNGWLNKVLAGNVDDHAKLVAHGVKLKVGRKYDPSKLKAATLLAKVQTALTA